MKVHKITSKKSKAQAMVEFAIVLPILLLLLYGLLEAGRLLFIYSTIVTASRQAVRYGSATGLGVSSTVPRYRDCQGIRESANRVDFLNSFDHLSDDVKIAWDSGPGTTPNPICPVGAATETVANYNPTNNNTRLLVTIDGDYLPIVPKIIPFVSRSSADTPPDPIKAASARTVLVSVAIQVTIPPSTFLPNTPTVTPSRTPTPTPTPTNTPTFTPSPTPVFTDTPTQTPTNTATATITNTPTPTSTPTSIYTAAPCSAVTHGPIMLPPDKSIASTMSMTITNPYPYPLTIGSGYVVWNNDSGHQTGGDKTLHLTSASIGGVTFWTGDISSHSTTITAMPGLTINIPPGTSTLVFGFHQTYDNQDNSEEILINLSTNGCQLYPIHEKIQP